MSGRTVGFHGGTLAATMATGLLAVLLPCKSTGCLVQEHCYQDRDCGANQVCDLGSGSCVVECTQDSDCGGVGFFCEQNTCVFHCEGGEIDCPEGMVSVCGIFCIDIYEASRPDATSNSSGSDSSMAVSQAGVLPWYETDSTSMNKAVASAACLAAGKRLCTSQEWEAVCRGPDDLEYCYGNQYEATTCNGIDAFCLCESEPYPHCFDDCGSEYSVMPTGYFKDCTNAFGIFDINGNVWENVDSTDGLDHYRGGAYNCSDSEKLHACGYEATWDPSTKGFRCCADGNAR